MRNTRQELEAAIAALDDQRSILGDEAVDAAIEGIRSRLAPKEKDDPARRRIVTVLFADVVGFTALSEALDPEEIRESINQLWARIDEIIETAGGRIDKHIGDAVMALFGAPVVHEDDAERAVRAALSMQNAVSQISRRLGHSLSMRIGINTGPVILGSVGSTKEYTALGDTVNLASRLEEASDVGGILISADTYRQVRGVFDVLPPRSITVKGKREPIEVYGVQREKARAFRRRSFLIEGAETPMVGRQAEMARLQSAYEEAADDGSGRCVTVLGEAGMGKSRLAWSFLEWLDLRSEPIWLFQGRVTREQQRQPFALLRDILSSRFGLHEEGASPEELLLEGFREIMGDDGANHAPLIGHLAGFDFAEHPKVKGIVSDSSQIKTRAFHGLVRLLEETTRHGRALLFLDDLQWADEGSLDLLVHLQKSCAAMPILFVIFGRPELEERRPGLCATPDVLRLRIERLGQNDAQELTSALLGRLPSPPEDLVSRIVDASGGNPFHIEELVRMLFDESVIVQEGDSWVLVDEKLQSFAAPPTLVALLQARLDSLPFEEQRLLEHAAVVGRAFWPGAVEAISGDATDTAADFGPLVRRGLVAPRDPPFLPGEGELAFDSELLREVAYERVLLKARALAHRSVAHWLANRVGDADGGLAPVVAEHFELSGDTDEAGRWYARAGQAAASSFAVETALANARRAMTLLEKSTSMRQPFLHSLETIAEMQRVIGNIEEAEATYERVALEAASLGDATMEGRGWMGVAHTKWVRGAAQDILPITQKIRAAAKRSDDEGRELMAHARVLEGWANQRMGKMNEALRIAQVLRFTPNEPVGFTSNEPEVPEAPGGNRSVPMARLRGASPERPAGGGGAHDVGSGHVPVAR